MTRAEIVAWYEEVIAHADALPYEAQSRGPHRYTAIRERSPHLNVCTQLVEEKCKGAISRTHQRHFKRRFTSYVKSSSVKGELVMALSTLLVVRTTDFSRRTSRLFAG
jgi:hypothetical protein